VATPLFIGGVVMDIKPYSAEDYEKAKQQGLDLDNWDNYVTYFELGENDEV
jgi:hypothetical protein